MYLYVFYSYCHAICRSSADSGNTSTGTGLPISRVCTNNPINVTATTVLYRPGNAVNTVHGKTTLMTVRGRQPLVMDDETS